MKKEVKFYDQNEEITVAITIDENGKKEFKVPEGYTLYPMEYECSNDPGASKYDPDLICDRYVGRTSRISYMVPVPEKMYHAILAPEKAEDKRKERAAKCKIPGKRETSVMCRESSCRKAQIEGRCPKMMGTAFVIQQVTYIEELDEVTDEDQTSRAALGQAVYDEILDLLEKKQKKLAAICELKVAGYKNREIGQMLHINENTVETDVRRIRELIDIYYKN